VKRETETLDTTSPIEDDLVEVMAIAIKTVMMNAAAGNYMKNPCPGAETEMSKDRLQIQAAVQMMELRGHLALVEANSNVLEQTITWLTSLLYFAEEDDGTDEYAWDDATENGPSWRFPAWKWSAGEENWKKFLGNYGITDYMNDLGHDINTLDSDLSDPARMKTVVVDAMQMALSLLQVEHQTEREKIAEQLEALYLQKAELEKYKVVKKESDALDQPHVITQFQENQVGVLRALQQYLEPKRIKAIEERQKLEQQKKILRRFSQGVQTIKANKAAAAAAAEAAKPRRFKVVPTAAAKEKMGAVQQKLQKLEAEGAMAGPLPSHLFYNHRNARDLDRPANGGYLEESADITESAEILSNGVTVDPVSGSYVRRE